MKSLQRGGFVVGLIVGLLVGLVLALGVALYVTKVPVPFLNKVPQHTPEQDAAEVERNKHWDPNSPLYGKNPARPASAVEPPASFASGVVTAPPAASRPLASASAASGARRDARDPAALLGDNATAASAASGAGGRVLAEPVTYYVQAGAYARNEDAEQQRAKLTILGFDAAITEREQAGRTVYRVRVGPYEQKSQADEAKATLDGNGLETALVRVQR